MTTIIDEYISGLLEKLEQNEDADLDDIEAVGQYLILAMEAVRKCQAWLHSNTFADEMAQIHFYKHQKPILDSRVLYYQLLLGILQHLPVSDPEEIVSYCRQQIKKCRKFVVRHHRLHLYYKSRAVYLDRSYFVVPSDTSFVALEGGPAFIDLEHHTIGSYYFAYFIALELIERFLTHKITMNLSPDAGEHSGDGGFRWTGTQSELTELIYMFNELSLFNGKQHEISKLTAFICKKFNTKINNVYKTHERNRIRIKSRTPLLDRGKLALLRKYDHDDEYAPG